MSDKENSGDKTEKPTPKRLKDARKKGDVFKSKDVTGTVSMIFWIIILFSVSSYFLDRFLYFLNRVISISYDDTQLSEFLRIAGNESISLFITTSLILIVPATFFAVAVEFLQVGPVLTSEKFKPNFENLNPASGLKKMFSMDNLVELLKSVIKTILLMYMGWLILSYSLNDVLTLPKTTFFFIPKTLIGLLFKLVLWSSCCFLFIAILDAGYQRYSYMKKMRMSVRDIKKEMKDSEGDPYIKQQRRQAHQEWSANAASQVVPDSNVIVVNPTHLAVALQYDKETVPVPIVSLKGHDAIARTIRETADELNIPVLRNVDLARKLYADTEEGDFVPSELFEIVADVILWSKSVKQRIDAVKNQEDDTPETIPKPPGEDLTRYPEDE